MRAFEQRIDDYALPLLDSPRDERREVFGQDQPDPATLVLLQAAFNILGSTCISA